METTDTPQCAHRGCYTSPKRKIAGRLFCGRHAKKFRR